MLAPGELITKKSIGTTHTEAWSLDASFISFLSEDWQAPIQLTHHQAEQQEFNKPNISTGKLILFLLVCHFLHARVTCTGGTF